MLYGTSGNDSIYIPKGRGILYGEDGDDNLSASQHDNANDILDGGAGNDNLYGGEGNDIYVFAKGHGKDYISDSAGESDTIQFLDVNFEEVKF